MKLSIIQLRWVYVLFHNFWLQIWFFFSGDGLWNDLAMEVQGVETTYNQMPQVMSAKTNAQQLEQFSKTFML